MNKIWIILSLVTLFIFDIKSQDTIHVISYNLLNYDSSTDRNNEFKKIFQFLKPDVILAQEIIGLDGANNFLDNVLKEVDENYAAAEFIDDPRTSIDQGLFYNSKKFNFLNSSFLDGYPRPIYIFNLKHLLNKKSRKRASLFDNKNGSKPRKMCNVISFPLIFYC